MRSVEDRRILSAAAEIKRKERKAQKAARAPRVQPKAPGQREPRVKDNVYLAWIRRLPCIRCGATRKVEAMHIRSGYPEAGWKPTGMQQKPDDHRTAPGCAECHREGPHAQHRTNERAWWAAIAVYPPQLCAALQDAFKAGLDGAAVVAEFRRRPT